MKKLHLIVGITVLLFGLITSLFVLHTPVANYSADNEFNVLNALEYISVIADEEHSVFDTDNHETVRLYLKDKLEEFIGAENVYEMDYPGSETGDDIDYDIHNLLGVIPGSSDTAIMLVAHYDSRGHIGRSGELGGSYGAADDGYGLAVLLEIARLYSNRSLTNSIYILITDGEETGLYGAALAATETEIMDNVGFVINIEARGITGPAVMFETSSDNEKVIDFYRNANLEVSYSLATAVYTVMPNMTDFTEFLAIGKQGVNFAVLDSLYYYHTPLDNYTNVDPSSLQHYGEQIVPLVEEFVTDATYSDTEYFVGSGNQVFFTLFTNVFISYTDSFAQALHLILLIGFLGLIVWMFIKKSFTIKQLLVSLIYVIGLIIIVVISGLYVSKFIAYTGSVPWNLTYVRMEGTELPTLIFMLVFVFGLAFLYHKFIKRPEAKVAFLIAGTFINLLLTIMTGYVLSGASFLFLVPAVTGFLALLLISFDKTSWLRHVVLGIMTIIGLWLLLPILHELFLALTVGGLLALGAILVFYLLVFVPTFFYQVGKRHV